jgi:hypothetical protein
MRQMIKLCTVLSAVLVFLFPTFASADGPPIDSVGNPTTQCVKLQITKSQSKDIDIRRMVTLTESQMKAIAANWGTRTIGIVSEEWKDCTCGMLYSFWAAQNEISIPKHMISLEQELREHQKREKKENSQIEDWDFLNYLRRAIIMDRNGVFYKNGKPLSVPELKAEYIKEIDAIIVNVPSLRILNTNKRNAYLKKLTEAGIAYQIFG